MPLVEAMNAGDLEQVKVAQHRLCKLSTMRMIRSGVVSVEAFDVGFTRRIAAIDMRIVGNIFMSWVVTLPAGAILSILFFFMLKGMFS